MSQRMKLFAIAMVGVVLTSAALVVIFRGQRQAGIDAVEAMGGSVRIRRVNQMFLPIKKTVCWVKFTQSNFSERELEQLIRALQRIGVRDTRIDLGRTTVDDAGRQQLMSRIWGIVQIHGSPVNLE